MWFIPVVAIVVAVVLLLTAPIWWKGLSGFFRFMLHQIDTIAEESTDNKIDNDQKEEVK